MLIFGPKAIFLALALGLSGVCLGLEFVALALNSPALA